MQFAKVSDLPAAELAERDEIAQRIVELWEQKTSGDQSSWNSSAGTFVMSPTPYLAADRSTKATARSST